MKRVGIATFHQADNYGAVLQCYALQKTMNRLPGVIAKVMDYRYYGNQFPDKWVNETQKKQFREKRDAFERFLTEHCSLSEEPIHQIDGDGYDYCCVGSDQIWNTTNPIVGEYFLPNVRPGVKKIAYAASVGCSATDPGFCEDPFIRYVSQFKAISVREKEHVKVLSRLTGQPCPCVLDPTLLLDAADYYPVMAPRKETEPYLFFYWLPHDRQLYRGLELANSIARKYDLNIVHTLYNVRDNVFAGKNVCMYYEGVEDFLRYIQDAAFVVTNSYHGTIFSIHFGRPFYTILVKSMQSRFDTLLGYADIGGRIVNQMIPYDSICAEMDFTSIQDEIRKHRKDSMCFLQNALDIG